MGSASDLAPLEVWLEDGTPLDLRVDLVVSSAAGDQRLFKGFAPTPPATLDDQFATVVQYGTMAELIDGAASTGDFSGPAARALQKVLKAEFGVVERLIADKQHAMALLWLKNFLGFVRTHAGKQISADFARTLQLDVLFLYHRQLCAAVTAGQLSATRAALNYIYYLGAVMSLGGTPRPPCA